jgi:hypothetical protein
MPQHQGHDLLLGYFFLGWSWRAVTWGSRGRHAGVEPAADRCHLVGRKARVLRRRHLPRTDHLIQLALVGLTGNSDRPGFALLHNSLQAGKVKDSPFALAAVTAKAPGL